MVAPVSSGQWHEPDFAERYDAGFATTVAPVVAARLLRHIDVTSIETILECACGTGACTIPLARAAGARVRLASCDRSLAMLAIATRKAKQLTSDAATPGFSLQDMLSLAVPDGRVDLVVSNLGLHVVPDKLPALNEARRILRAGGRAAYSVPGDWSLEPFQTLFWDRVSKPDVAPALTAPVRRWDEAERSVALAGDQEMWRRSLIDAGFDDVQAVVERETIWFASADHFFAVGPFGQTRRAREMLSGEPTKELVFRDLTAALEATRGDRGVPLSVTTLCLVGTRSRA